MTELSCSPFKKDVNVRALPTFAAALQDATDFVTVGSLACDHNRQLFGMQQTAVVLFRADGGPAISVDDIPKITDEHRLRYFASSWHALEPHIGQLRASHLPITDDHVTAEITQVAIREGYTGDPLCMLVLPLLEPAGVIGMIVCGSWREHTEALRVALMLVAHHASVRLAQLGIRRTHEPSLSSLLTARQLEVARLAGRGRINAGIGDALDMSENTVKKHLKDIFERLEVTTRAELAAILHGAAPREDVPIGITRRGHLTITRAR